MKRSKSPVNLDDLAGQLSDALGFVECAVAALREEETGGPALVVLEHGIAALLQVHRDLDRASAP